VIRFMFANGASHRVKVKSDHYKALHHVATGITPKHILQALRSSEEELTLLRNDTPEEFIDWFDGHVSDFRAQVHAIVTATKRKVGYLRQDGCIAKRDISMFFKQNTHWPDGTKVSSCDPGFMYCAFDDVAEFESKVEQETRPRKLNPVRDRVFKLVVVSPASSSAPPTMKFTSCTAKNPEAQDDSADQPTQQQERIRPMSMAKSQQRREQKHRSISSDHCTSINAADDGDDGDRMCDDVGCLRLGEEQLDTTTAFNEGKSLLQGAA